MNPTMIGFSTLLRREVSRFLKVWAQTLGAPVVTTLLFLAVFVLALGDAKREVDGTPYVAFLGAGLAMMAIAQNAFANTSSSLAIARMQGNLVDLLMAPLPPAVFLGGLVGGAIARGMAVGAVSIAAIAPFAGFSWADVPLLLLAAFFAAAMMGLLGVLAGLWAEKIDQLAAVTNFVITPLAFLSGTFYSIHRLPDGVRHVAYVDPLFWMMDAFRAGLTGHADGRPWLGLVALAVVTGGLWVVTLRLVKSGWRLRA